MANGKEDRRVKKTKRAIRNAFAELLSQKDINEITVKDIAETADINRKTFYNYYSGVYQVVDDIENEIVSTFEQALAETPYHGGVSDPYLVFVKLLETLQQDPEFYGNLFQMSANSNLTEKIIEILKRRALESMQKKIDLPPNQLEIAVNYLFYGMLAVFQQWFRSGRAEPMEGVSRIVSVLSVSGFNGLLSAQ